MSSGRSRSAGSTISITANVQPYDGSVLRVLPEGLTADIVRHVWTVTELKVKPQPDTLVIDGKKEAALLRDYQMHAYRPLVLHFDFQRIDATHEIHVKVPLHFINEEVAPGVKLNGGLVNHVMTEVDVHCLAADLPGFIEVDLGALKIGDSIHLSQLQLPKGVKLVAHATDDVVVGVVGKGGSSEAAEEGEAAAE